MAIYIAEYNIIILTVIHNLQVEVPLMIEVTGTAGAERTFDIYQSHLDIDMEFYVYVDTLTYICSDPGCMYTYYIEH